MPLYEFKCKKCGKNIIKLMSLNEDSSHIICECGYIAQRVLSAFNFEIRGFNSNNGYSKKDK